MDLMELRRGLLMAMAGQASSYTLLISKEFEVSPPTDNSPVLVGTITNLTGAYTADKILYVKIRDKAGKRAGYFYGNDTFLVNINAANNKTIELTGAIRCTYTYKINSTWSIGNHGGTTGYGVYAYSITNDGTLSIYARYHSTNSLTIDGTYICDVYLLDWPNGVSPFNE